MLQTHTFSMLQSNIYDTFSTLYFEEHYTFSRVQGLYNTYRNGVM